MKNKIAIVVLLLISGCNQAEQNIDTVSKSKNTVITKAIEYASPGVVSIFASQEITKFSKLGPFTLKSEDIANSSGSGFIISKDGYILTSAHVVSNFYDPSISLASGRAFFTAVLPGGDSYNAYIVGADTRSDVALLKIDSEKEFQYCILGNSDEIIVGEWVVTLGNPKSLFSAANNQPIASAGIISAINTNFGIDIKTNRLMNNMIQIDAPLNSGNSGGPLVDINGEVLGINTFKRDGENLGFAIKINYAKKIGEELKLKGFIDRRFSFGINAVSYRYGQNGDIGLYINSVDYDSSGDNKALYKGDIIIGVEGYQVQTYDEIQLVLANTDARPGDTIELRILRENDIKVVKLVLGST